MSAVAVVGSLNCDLVMRVPRHPVPGETVIGTGFDVFVGGKGNNQAIACARAGAKVAMVGRIGRDAFGDTLLARLVAEGIDHSHVLRDETIGTGVATILVDARGENTIGVAPLANGRLGAADVAAAAPVIRGARVLLLQLEIPVTTAIAAARIAREAGVKVILNPAPAPRDPAPLAELLSLVDVVVPNQSEAELLTGVAATDAARATTAAERLRELGPREVVVTLGALGALVLADAGAACVPSFPIAVIDTTAAGDAFTGAMAAALAEGASLERATRWGCAAGALACTKLGAEPSLPGRAAIAALAGER